MTMKPQLPPPREAGETPPKDLKDETTSLMQRAVTLPEFQSAFSVMSAFDDGGNLDIGSLLHQFRDAADAINNGNMEGPERMAISQAKVLDMLFHELLRRGMANADSAHFEPLMKLALKAQAQSARTLETLAVLKKPPVFANQVNMANQQVVNNAPATLPASPVETRSSTATPALNAPRENIVRLVKTRKRHSQRHALE